MLKYLAGLLLCFAFWSATAQDAAVSKDTPAADPAEQAKDKEFKPPPGFVTKKRGKLVLYCKKDSTIGTRFKTEKCYDEAQVRDYLLVQAEQKRDIDRIRATCATASTCSHN